MVYYGISLNVGSFGLDIYLTQLIFGLVDIPACIGSAVLIEHFGRRKCQAATMFCTGSACLVMLAIPNGTSQIFCNLAECIFIQHM